MKKFLALPLLMLMTLAAFPAERIKIGPYAGYFRPGDRLFQEIYGKGDGIYGGRFGIRIINGISLWFSYGQYKVTGQTTFTQERTTITLNPINASLRFNLRIGFFRPYVAAGYTYLNYREDSAIGNVKGNGKNYSADGGFEIRFSRHYFWDIGVRFEQIKVTPGSADLGSIDLGGLQLGTSFYISF